jgi:hypothetical protein
MPDDFKAPSVLRWIINSLERYCAVRARQNPVHRMPFSSDCLRLSMTTFSSKTW